MNLVLNMDFFAVLTFLAALALLLPSENLDGKELLRESVQIMQRSDRIDATLLLDISAEQVKCGDKKNARASLKLFLEETRIRIAGRPSAMSLLIRLAKADELASVTPTVVDIVDELSIVQELSPGQRIGLAYLNKRSISVLADQGRLAEADHQFLRFQRWSLGINERRTESQLVESATKIASTHIRDGKVDAGLAYITKFDDPMLRARAAALIGSVALDYRVNLERIEESFSLPDSSVSLWHKAKIEFAVAKGGSHVDVGLQALKELERVSDIKDLATYAAIGEMLRRANRVETARELLLQCANSIDESEEDERNVHGFRKLVEQLDLIGEKETATRLAALLKRQDIQKNPTGSLRDHPLYSIAIGLSRTDVDQALEIADQIDDTYWRVLTYCAIANVLDAEEQTLKTELLQYSIELVATIDNMSEKDSAIARIVRGQVETGQLGFRGAMELLKVIETPKKRARILAPLVQHLMSIEQISEAEIEEAIGSIEASSRSHLQYIVDGYRLRKEWSKAADTILRIDLNSNWNRDRLGKFVSPFFQSRGFEESLKFFKKLDPMVLDVAVLQLLPQLDANQKDRVFRQVVDSLPAKGSRIEMHLELGRHFMELEDWPSVKKVCDSGFRRDATETRFKNEFQRLVESRIKSSGQSSVDELERIVDSELAAKPIKFARIQADMNSGDFEAALERIQKLTDDLERARWTFELGCEVLNK